MNNFKPLKIEEILDQINRGSTLDLGHIEWKSHLGQFVVNVTKLKAFDSTVVKGKSGMPITIHCKKGPQ